VKEKTRDIGILRAYGFQQKKIRQIFILEGIFLGIIGIICGTVISIVILFVLKHYSLPFVSSAYYMTKLPVNLSLSDWVISILETLIIIVVFTFLPAYKASKMKVVEALKYE
jgi:lipoprotein-releasing system permease protein